jgi:flagellin-like hook-associated protein FlgL
MAGITLNEGIRNNLLSLQQTTRNIEETQFKLSTGKKVNSVLDDPLAFFKSQNLSFRASDLAARKDGIVQAQKTIEAATTALDSLIDLAKQAQAILESIQSAAVASEASGLITDLLSVKTAMLGLMEDAGYQGVNLLGVTTVELKVKFNQDGDNILTLNGAGATAVTGLADITAFGTAVVGTAANSAVSAAAKMLQGLREISQGFATKSGILDARREFTENLVNTLEGGSAALVNADTNQESANMLALQTRQQLGTISLSIANQSEQAVLRLF